MTFRRPLVSVAVPTRNRATLLDRTLARLLSQTYTNLEIVVCDNASVDTTESVVLAHIETDARIRYQRNASDIGAVRNFELGLLLSSGDLFVWAADDDTWDDDYIARLVDVFEHHEGVALACTETRFVTPTGIALPARVHGEKFRTTAGTPELEERLRTIITNAADVFVYGLFARENLVRAPWGTVFSVFGGCDLYAYGDHRGMNEIAVLVQVAVAGRVVVLPDPGWTKTIDPTVYAAAVIHDGVSANVRGSARAGMNLGRAARAISWRIPRDLAYHRASLRDIEGALTSLDLTSAMRRRLNRLARRHVLAHLVMFERNQLRQALTQIR
jgi:glycosyltransferase involved in cell wall biosynthesis